MEAVFRINVKIFVSSLKSLKRWIFQFEIRMAIKRYHISPTKWELCCLKNRLSAVIRTQFMRKFGRFSFRCAGTAINVVVGFLNVWWLLPYICVCCSMYVRYWNTVSIQYQYCWWMYNVFTFACPNSKLFSPHKLPPTLHGATSKGRVLGRYY